MKGADILMSSKSEQFEKHAVEVLESLNVSEEEANDMTWACGLISGLAACKFKEESSIEEFIIESELSEENKAALFKLLEDLDTIIKSASDEGS